jgi:hypothetical protein
LNEKLAKTQTSLDQQTSVNIQITSEKDEIDKELLVLRELSKGQKIQIDALLVELEQSKFLFETTSKDSQLELKVKMEQLSKELNSRWSETLRLECEKLRAELLRVKEEEKLLELNKLADLRDREMAEMKAIWQSKINELLNEISELKLELNEREIHEKEKYDQIKSDLEAENRDLIEQLNKLKDEYKIKFDHLQSQQNKEQKEIIEGLLRENEAKLQELRAQHLEDLKCQTLAQKSALSSLKAKLEKTKELELDMQLQEHNKKLGKFFFFIVNILFLIFF